MSVDYRSYTLDKDGFQIIPLTVPCAFRDGDAFFAYLQSLPELQLQSANVRSVNDLRPFHFGNDPLGILPFASTFHHVFNRDIRAIAYLHAIPVLNDYFAQNADSMVIEQLFDGFSVRGPGKHIPRRSARRAKMAIPYHVLKEKKIGRKLMQHAVKKSQELLEDDDDADDDDGYEEDDDENREDEVVSSVHVGDDEQDSHVSSAERKILSHVLESTSSRNKDEWLFTGWVNLSFPVPNANLEDENYLSKQQSINQFLTFIRNSHKEGEEDNDDAMSPSSVPFEDRVMVPPNSMVLIHPKLKTSISSGTIHHSFLIRQYVAFHVVSNATKPHTLFSSKTFEHIVEGLRVPYLPNGHRPCVYRVKDLEDYRQSHKLRDGFQQFLKVLSPSFCKTYRLVANNSLYAGLENRVLEENKGANQFLSLNALIESGRPIFPPKIMVHLDQRQEMAIAKLLRPEEEIDAIDDHDLALFDYDPLDLEFVCTFRSLASDQKSIDDLILTEDVQDLMFSREEMGFVELSEFSNYEEEEEEAIDEEDVDEEVEDNYLQKGGAGPPILTIKSLVWKNNTQYLPLHRRLETISHIKQVSNLMSTSEINSLQWKLLEKRAVYWQTSSLPKIKENPFTLDPIEYNNDRISRSWIIPLKDATMSATAVVT